MSQNAQKENGSRSQSEQQPLPSDPIGCYLPLLLFMLAFSAMGYLYVVTSLPTYRILFGGGGGTNIIGLLEKLLIRLHVPLGAMFSWMVSGIIITKRSPYSPAASTFAAPP